MTQWDIDTFALTAADRHYSQTLALPDMRGLTDGLVPSTRTAPPTITDVGSRNIYAEMIREVQDLLRDIRFCAAAGLMLALDAGTAQTPNPVIELPDVPGLFITEAEIATLLTSDEFVPPSTLATDRHRHRHIGGGQTLGAWFAGLMLDTALVKLRDSRPSTARSLSPTSPGRTARPRRFVVFELKAVAAEPEHVGKLNFYVNAVDDQLRRPEHGDGSTIRILLAADRDDVAVQYSLRGLTMPLAISTYTNYRALPDDV